MTSEKSNDSTTFFDEFPYVSYEEWKAEVERLLKGAPFDKKMRTPTIEGFTLEPIYLREDLEGTNFHETMPGFAPFVRGQKAFSYGDTKWLVNQELRHPDYHELNKALSHDLERGLQAIHLPLDKASRKGTDPDQAENGDVGAGGVSIASLKGFEKALKGIQPGKHPIFLGVGTSGFAFLGILNAWMRKNGLEPSALEGALKWDPIGEWANEGTLSAPLDQLLKEQAMATAWCAKNAPQFGTVWISGVRFGEAGADAVREIAYSMATALTYLREMEKHGLPPEMVVPHMRFDWTLGTNFFMEVGKLRAARMVWNRILESMGIEEADRFYWSHASTAERTLTKIDPYVNMLRTTTEAFSGVVGGVDSLHVMPFNATEGLDEPFARRIARNIQYILRDETHLGKIMDPAGGSYYVENLTQEIASKAWTYLQEIEANGGMRQALGSGDAQKACAQCFDQRVKAVAARKDVLVGVNQYPNADEKRLEGIHFDYPAFQEKRSKVLQTLRTEPDQVEDVNLLKQLERLMNANGDSMGDVLMEAVAAGATIGEIYRTIRARLPKSETIEKLQPRRISEGYEALRYKVEEAAASGKDVSIFMATIGPAGKYMPRLDFAASFFEVAGFKVIRTMGHDTAEEAADRAKKSGARVAVICGLDPSYEESVPVITNRLKDTGMKVFLAGYPADESVREGFLKNGLNQFIHVRTNAYSFLKELATELEVF